MSSNIAPLGPSLTSQARAAELNAANAARARIMSGELGDISELPSAQPVSLGDFAVRSQTNNKGPKSWKPFPLDDRTDEQAGGTATVTGETFRRPHRPVDRYFPPNASPSPAYPAPRSHLESLSVPYYSHGTYQVPDYQYPMYQGMNYYQQMYPGQMGYYHLMPAVPPNYPMMQRSPSPVKSPNRRLRDRPVNCFVRQDMSPIKQKVIVRSKSAGDDVDKKQDNEHQTKEYILPCSSSDSPSKRIAAERKESSHSTPEEALRDIFRESQKRQRQDPPSTPEQAICHPKQESPVKDQPQIDATVPNDAEQNLPTPSRLVAQSPSSQSDSSPQSILQSNSAKLAAPPRFLLADAHMRLGRASEDRDSASKGPETAGFNIGLSSIRDDCRGLTAIKEQVSLIDTKTSTGNFDLNTVLNDAPKTYSHHEKDIFDLEDPFAAEQNDESQPERPPVKPYVPLVNKYEKNVFASEETREKELANNSIETTWKELQGGLRRIKVPGSRSAHSFTNDLLSAEKKDVKVSKISYPPPGLGASSASYTSVYYERVLEAEDWFHQGNNLQDDLPLEFGQRLAQLEKAVSDNEELRQTSDVYKRVMANFYSYSRTYKPNGKRISKSLGFADLGPVSDSCCEPRYGGRRSLFDNNPCARLWRLQTATRFIPSDFVLSSQRQATLSREHNRSSLSLR